MDECLPHRISKFWSKDDAATRERFIAKPVEQERHFRRRARASLGKHDVQRIVFGVGDIRCDIEAYVQGWVLASA